MNKKKRRQERRRGWTSGALGVSYAAGGYFLSPAQFDYTTAQAADGATNTDASSSGTTDGGGDGSGGTA